MKLRIRNDVKIGIFALVIAGVIYWGINFLKGRDFFSRNITYYTTSEEIGDLSDAASVFIKGVRVGTVSRISYNPAVSSDVVIKMNVSPNYRIPRDTRAVLFTNGIMGGRAIRLDIGESMEFLHGGDTLASAVDLGLLDMSGKEVEQLKSKVNELADNFNATLLSLNRLFEENNDNIASTIRNLNALSRSLNNTLGGETVKGTIDNIHALSRSLKRDAAGFGRVIDNVERLTDSLTRAGLPRLASKLDASATRVNSLLDKVNSGDGTAGRLINDRALYDSLTRATADLSELLQDIKKNPKRYVHVSVF
jgi:phospholipid/cholesterol/gamma-HCH transport system substrate-binding protein